MKDAIGTPISLGAIVAYTGQDMRVHVAIVERLADNEYIAVRILHSKVFVSLGHYHLRAERALIIHPLHYTDEMRQAVLEWEEANPEIVLSHKSNEAVTYVYSGPPLKVQMDSHALAGGTILDPKLRATDALRPCHALSRLADDGGPALDE